MNVGICGGGNLAHAMAAWLGFHGHRVHLVTRRPADWANCLQASLPDGTRAEAPICRIAESPEILEDCPVVFLSAPRYAIRSMCERIRLHLAPEQLLALAPGTPDLLDMQADPAWQATQLMGIYKVPFICRTEVYGHSVSILGNRTLNRAWVSPAADWESSSAVVEGLFSTPLERLSSPYPFILTNSNPLLHPSRLSTMFADYRDGVAYDHNFLFYEEWTEEASERYISADAELLKLCSAIPQMRIGHDIIPVLEYYESTDAESLTTKIRSIPAFKGIPSPMLSTAAGWVPDFSSRYFTEDIPWGTALICNLARQNGIPTPTLDSFVAWNTAMLQQYGTTGIQHCQCCRQNCRITHLCSISFSRKDTFAKCPFKSNRRSISTIYITPHPYSIGKTVGYPFAA